jgi:hypothetical protein
MLKQWSNPEGNKVKIADILVKQVGTFNDQIETLTSYIPCARHILKHTLTKKITNKWIKKRGPDILNILYMHWVLSMATEEEETPGWIDMETTFDNLKSDKSQSNIDKIVSIIERYVYRSEEILS